jgi:hypothetical protein
MTSKLALVIYIPSSFRILVRLCTKLLCVPSPQLKRYLAWSKVTSKDRSVSDDGVVTALTSQCILLRSNGRSYGEVLFAAELATLDDTT